MALASGDRRLLVEALADVLKRRRGFDVVAPPTQEDEATLAVCRRYRPDVLIIDVDGETPSQLVSLIKAVRCGSGDTNVLLLSSRTEEEVLLVEYVEAGASGFLDKRQTLSEVVEGLSSVAEGGMIVDLHTLAGVLREARRERSIARRASWLFQQITPRELEILRSMADGLSNDEIALELHISVRTVATHSQNLFRKLGVHSRLQAVAVAHKDGLLAEEVPPRSA